MKHTIRAIIVAAFLAPAASAQSPIPDCDQDDAAARWDQAIAAGLISGGGMLNGLPTIQVARRDWANYPLEARLGMIATMDCAAFGGESFFRTIQIVDQGGRVLATWDGLRRRLDVRE